MWKSSLVWILDLLCCDKLMIVSLFSYDTTAQVSQFTIVFFKHTMLSNSAKNLTASIYFNKSCFQNHFGKNGWLPVRIWEILRMVHVWNSSLRKNSRSEITGVMSRRHVVLCCVVRALYVQWYHASSADCVRTPRYKSLKLINKRHHASSFHSGRYWWLTLLFNKPKNSVSTCG